MFRLCCVVVHITRLPDENADMCAITSLYSSLSVHLHILSMLACVTWRDRPRSSAIPTITAWVASDVEELLQGFQIYFLFFRLFFNLEFQSSCFTYYCEMKYFLHSVILRASELDGALLNKLMMNNKWLILSSCEPWRLAQSEKNIIRNTGIYSRGPKSLISHRQ